jgi:hypothetical protein
MEAAQVVYEDAGSQRLRVLKYYEESVGRPARSSAEVVAWVADHRDELPLDDDGKLRPLVFANGP